jgi:hypothetical protein
MKSMTFAVTIVGLMTFAQSAHAREHHYRHGHHHHIVASRGMSAAQGSGWSADSVWLGVQRQQVESLPSRRREILPFRQGRLIVAVTAGAPQRGAVGKCDISSAPIRSRHSIWRATGHIGVGLEQRELELLSFGRTTSEKSWVGKTANGSSNPATTAMRFARGRVQSPVRLS